MSKMKLVKVIRLTGHPLDDPEVRAELRRLRRVVRAAERTADAYESEPGIGRTALLAALLGNQCAAVAAYRKGKKKND